MRRITIQTTAIAFSLLLAMPTPTSRAQAPAVLAKGTVIVTLGTGGGPRPRVDRSQSANLLLVNGTPYLIDAGENVVRRLVQAGIDFNAIGHIFITHGHSDHTLGLPALMATQWEFQRREPVEIFGAPGFELRACTASWFSVCKFVIELTIIATSPSAAAISTKLPDRPDYAAANAFLLKARRSAFAEI